MRTVIIDDKIKSRQTIKNFISKYAPELEVIGEADNVEHGVELIDEQKPALVFLDIQMPDGTGFDLLGQITYSDFKLIFCTSYDQYAVKAFRFSAIDYILKPLDPDVFKAAVNKVLETAQSELLSQLEVLNSNKTDFTRIALHAADGITLVNITDIIRCESSGNYTRFVIKEQQNILVTKTLREFEETLSEHNFIRIHKSFLVNMSHIHKYIKGEGGWVIMSDNSKIEVARRKKDQFLKVLGKM